jgi:O-antigen ligase
VDVIEVLRKRYSLTRVYESATAFLWYALLVTVPITSFPIIAKLAGGSQVSPLAGAPLFLLVLLWLIPRFLKRRALPALSLPLLVFISLALLSICASFFIGIRPSLNQTPLSRSLRGFATLLVGGAFYLVAAQIPDSREKIRKSLRWLYLGAAITLFWSTLQTFYVLNNMRLNVTNPNEVPLWMNTIHRQFSTRSLFSRRVTGMAFEPSWLADQLVILYLPLWFASVFRRFSVFSQKKRILSVESGLAIWGSLILFMSQSRIGFLSCFAIIGVLGLLTFLAFERLWLERRVRRREARRQEPPSVRRLRLWRILVWTALIILLVCVILAVTLVLLRLDPRYARMFENWFADDIPINEDPVYVFANQLLYAERVVYWDAGYKTFAQHPFLGVGLGNAGFFFLDNMPVIGSRLPELISIINGWSEFPNTKSLWIRILAETGIVGFLTFLIWLGLHAGAARRLYKMRKGMLATLGLAGLLMLLSQFFEGFSLDTFALPQLWIFLGLIASAYLLRSDHLESGPAVS